MGSCVTVVLGVLTVWLCVCLCVQSETDSGEISLSESNKSCTSNVTNNTEGLFETDLKDVMLSSEVITEVEEVNDTDEIVNIENTTLFKETGYFGNETEGNFSMETTTSRSEVQTTQYSETTTEQLSTTIETAEEARPISNEICTCDLTMNSCDINCCCDGDCSDNDRLAFSGCHSRTQFNFDPRYCYQTHFVYHNNTELKLVQNTGGLFCIVRDNLPARFTFQNRKVVTTLHAFNKLQRNYRIFPWPTPKIDSITLNLSMPYRTGEIIWTVVNRTLIPFSLPVKITSALCQSSNLVYYLSDWSGRCSQVAASDIHGCENHPQLSAPTFYKGVTFVGAPQLINETIADHLKEDCPANVCIPVTKYLCSELNSEISSLDGCNEVSDLQTPVYSSNSRKCQNVVKEIKYMIYHNGTDGITKVCIYIWLENITMYTELLQKFSVSFHWTKDIENLFHRSGNPGYVVGKPVMTGQKVTQILGIEGEVDKEAIELHENPEEWLSIATAMKDGRCDWEEKYGHSFRQSVTFGEDRWSSCMIFVGPSNFSSHSACATLHKSIIYLLAGTPMENVTSAKKFNFFVATFGDSKPEETGDWVQVILENVPSFVISSTSKSDDWMLVCKGIVTHIHIDIMFANVGSLAIPQAKILGAVFRFGSPRDLTFTCSSLHCTQELEEQHFDIVSSVSFIDVTKPAITEFAEPPVYEIKLPHDFFYPFFSNSLNLKASNVLVTLGLIIRLKVG